MTLNSGPKRPLPARQMGANTARPNTDTDVGSTRNPPEQQAISCHSGDHATFLQRMLAHLRTQTVPSDDDGETPPPPLADFTTRERDDPTIALLDAWATVADNLSFYQDRIANEGYLRTATERRSVLELSQGIGYTPAPGVAAGVWLAFAVDDADASPPSAEVPKRTRVLSIPAQGQMPQAFETSATITAWKALNEFRPRVQDPQPFTKPQQWLAADGIKQLLIEQTAANLKVGDHVFLVGPVKTASTGAVENNGTQRQLARIEGIDSQTYPSFTQITLAQSITYAEPVTAGDLRLFVFRQSAPLFESNAPQKKPVYDANSRVTGYSDWLDCDMPKAGELDGGQSLALDAQYPQIRQNSQVAITRPGKPAGFFQQTNADLVSIARYGLTARVTQLKLDRDWPTELAPTSMADWREVSVHFQSDELTLSPTVPDQSAAAPVIRLARQERNIRLDPTFSLPETRDPSFKGTFGIVGKSLDGLEVSELVTGQIVGLPGGDTLDGGGQFELHLDTDLRHDYQLDTVTFFGNVVLASHGETVSDEVLGSGNALQTNQRFLLRHAPLTYVAAATALGVVSTLSIRINGLLWHEVPSLLDQGSTSRCYTLQRDHRGRTIVIFGDGVSGARLPSGHENVVATYRHGLGPQGNVAAGALSLLPSRPYGIAGVVNPSAAAGGTAPATLAQARALAPRVYLPLGRLVSPDDYARLARSFGGIGKAQARLARMGAKTAGKPVVQITVAGIDGAHVLPDSDLFSSLQAALRSHSNGLHRIDLLDYQRRSFALSARVLIDPDTREEIKFAAIRERLIDKYGFDRRTFGQGISSSEVIADIQSVAGVLAVDLNLLALVDKEGQLAEMIHKTRPEIEPDLDPDQATAQLSIMPAQLLVIDVNQIDLEVWNG